MFAKNSWNWGFRYNQEISPFPWHFVKLRFHCMRLCKEACMCSVALTMSPSTPPPFPCSTSTTTICKCIHLHLGSLCIKADIKVQKRNCTVFCLSIDYTNKLLLFSTLLLLKVPSLGLGWQWNWKYRDLYEIVFLDLILIYCVCRME